MNKVSGTLHYLAPEILYENGYDLSKIDVWTLGIVIYHMIVEKYPFEDKESYNLK